MTQASSLLVARPDVVSGRCGRQRGERHDDSPRPPSLTPSLPPPDAPAQRVAVALERRARRAAGRLGAHERLRRPWLAPQEPPTLADDEGFVALSIYASQRLDHVQFVRKGPARRGLSLYGEEGNGDLHLFRVRAGEYCLRSVTSQGSTAIDHDERSCFVVRARRLNTPGALHIERVPGPYPRVWTSWEPPSAHATRAIAARWPWLTRDAALTSLEPRGDAGALGGS